MPDLRLLGGAVLENEERVVQGPAGRRHPVAVLALLATSPSRTLSRGKLVGLLWPDAPEKTARGRLNTCVHRLRKTLGSDVLTSAGDGLRLDPEALRCDVVEFEEALEAGDPERAVELYGGPFLDGFQLGDSPDFEKRVDRERERLRRAYREALEALAEAAEAEGEPEVAALWWKRRAGDDPYDSRVARRLMEALEAAGNRAGAIRVGEVHTALLEQELDAAPNPEILALVERLRGEPEPPEASAPRLAGSAEAPDAAEAPTTIANSPGAERPADPGGTAAEDDRPRVLQRAILGAVMVVGVVGASMVGIWYLVGASPGAGVGGAEARTEARAVAVLPFEFVGEGEGSTFARAVHTDIVNRLSGLSGILVISPSSAGAIAEAGEPVTRVAADLGVDWIVQGEVQRAGDRVQVNARLVDARADRQVWGEGYRAELTAEDLFDVQSEIARGIADVLEIRLTAEEGERLATVPTRSTAAYELYLQAHEIAGSGAADEDRIDAQMSLYRRAVTLDSTFAAAWARLSLAFLSRAFAADEDRAAWADSALRAARRATALDPELAEAHVSLAFARASTGDADRLVPGLQRAFELQPTNLIASQNLAVALQNHGRLADALRVREVSHRLAPTERRPILGLSSMNRVLGRDAAAEAWLAVAREHGHSTLLPEAHEQLFLRGNLDRARVLIDSLAEREEGVTLTRLRAALALYEGDWREGRRLYGSLYPGHPYASSPLFLGLLWDQLGLAWSHLKLGEEGEAREIAAEVIRTAERELEGRRRPGVTATLNHRLTVARLILGDTTAALDRLERTGPASLDYLQKLETVPVLEPLRDHPRFRASVAGLRERLAEERRRAELEGMGEPPALTGPNGGPRP